MDPLTAIGAVASVLQLAEAAVSLSKTLYSVSSALKSAKEDIIALADDLDTFSKSLTVLHRLLHENGGWYSDDVYLLTAKIIKDCAELYRKIGVVLEKLGAASAASAVAGRGNGDGGKGKGKGGMNWGNRVGFVVKGVKIKKLLERLRDMKGTMATILMSLQLDLQLNFLNAASRSKLQRPAEKKLQPKTLRALREAKMALDGPGILGPDGVDEKEEISEDEDDAPDALAKDFELQKARAKQPSSEGMLTRDTQTAGVNLAMMDFQVQNVDLPPRESALADRELSDGEGSNASGESFKSAVSEQEEEIVKEVAGIIHAFETALTILKTIQREKVKSNEKALQLLTGELAKFLKQSKEVVIKKYKQAKMPAYRSFMEKLQNDEKMHAELQAISSSIMEQVVVKLHIYSARHEILQIKAFEELCDTTSARQIEAVNLLDPSTSAFGFNRESTEEPLVPSDFAVAISSYGPESENVPDLIVPLGKKYFMEEKKDDKTDTKTGKDNLAVDEHPTSVSEGQTGPFSFPKYGNVEISQSIMHARARTSFWRSSIDKIRVKVRPLSSQDTEGGSSRKRRRHREEEQDQEKFQQRERDRAEELYRILQEREMKEIQEKEQSRKKLEMEMEMLAREYEEYAGRDDPTGQDSIPQTEEERERTKQIIQQRPEEVKALASRRAQSDDSEEPTQWRTDWRTDMENAINAIQMPSARREAVDETVNLSGETISKLSESESHSDEPIPAQFPSRLERMEKEKLVSRFSAENRSDDRSVLEGLPARTRSSRPSFPLKKASFPAILQTIRNDDLPRSGALEASIWGKAYYRLRTSDPKAFCFVQEASASMLVFYFTHSSFSGLGPSSQQQSINEGEETITKATAAMLGDIRKSLDSSSNSSQDNDNPTIDLLASTLNVITAVETTLTLATSPKTWTLITLLLRRLHLLTKHNALYPSHLHKSLLSVPEVAQPYQDAEVSEAQEEEKTILSTKYHFLTLSNMASELLSIASLVARYAVMQNVFLASPWPKIAIRDSYEKSLTELAERILAFLGWAVEIWCEWDEADARGNKGGKGEQRGVQDLEMLNGKMLSLLGGILELDQTCQRFRVMVDVVGSVGGKEREEGELKEESEDGDDDSDSGVEVIEEYDEYDDGDYIAHPLKR